MCPVSPRCIPDPIVQLYHGRISFSVPFFFTTLFVSRLISHRSLSLSLQFGYVWILLCEGLTPEQQLWNYKRRIENDVETELRENLVEDFKVTSRRLRLCLLGQDPHDAAAAAAAAAAASNPQ